MRQVSKTWNCVDDRGRVVLAGVERASSFSALFFGLALSKRERSMWLDHTSIVHTFGMRYSLDICFVDSDGAVLQVMPSMPPCRIAIGPPGTKAVIETFAGNPSRLSGVKLGQLLRLTDADAFIAQGTAGRCEPL